MLKSKLIRFINLTLAGMVAFFLVSCTKDSNTFLPYVKVSLYISLVNQNHLKIPGNSIMFKNYGVKGVIVSCINPDLGQYGAFDACCPNEKDYSGIVELEPVKNLTSPPGMVYSSGFFGKCNKCGSVFNLMGNGQPVSGPATHYLQSYNISTGFETLTVIN